MESAERLSLVCVLKQTNQFHADPASRSFLILFSLFSCIVVPSKPSFSSSCPTRKLFVALVYCMEAACLPHANYSDRIYRVSYIAGARNSADRNMTKRKDGGDITSKFLLQSVFYIRFQIGRHRSLDVTHSHTNKHLTRRFRKIKIQRS
jgi:hypothetical protein